MFGKNESKKRQSEELEAKEPKKFREAKSLSEREKNSLDEICSDVKYLHQLKIFLKEHPLKNLEKEDKEIILSKLGRMLFNACCEKNPDEKIIGFLLKNGADANYSFTPNKRTPIQKLWLVEDVYHSIKGFKPEAPMKLIELLINYKANLDATIYEGDYLSFTFLSYACLRQNPPYNTIKFLLDNGANPNHINGVRQNTAFHKVCTKHPSNHQLIELFVKHGAKFSLKDLFGTTPYDILKSQDSEYADQFKVIVEKEKDEPQNKEDIFDPTSPRF